MKHKPVVKLVRQNLRLVKQLYPSLLRKQLRALCNLTQTLRLSLSQGDILLIDGKWYVTHSGLLRLARRSHCAGISVEAVPELSDPTAGRWAFKATVYRSTKCKGFVGYGDADPSNVSPLVRGAEMRIAETRSVNRALRKAYGIGLCSVEEIGSAPLPSNLNSEPIIKREPNKTSGSYGNGNGQPSLRDRLSQLIRQNQLNPALVKLYAADYCGTQELRQATREQIVSFINHLSEQATKDREALLCQLNAYGQKQAGAA
jgi:hypothetical protein